MHEAASMKRVKKLTSSKVIGINDLDGTRELVWEVEKVIAHTKLTGDIMYVSSSSALGKIIENCFPYALQQAWNKKAYKFKMMLGC